MALLQEKSQQLGAETPRSVLKYGSTFNLNRASEILSLPEDKDMKCMFIGYKDKYLLIYV